MNPLGRAARRIRIKRRNAKQIFIQAKKFLKETHTSNQIRTENKIREINVSTQN